MYMKFLLFKKNPKYQTLWRTNTIRQNTATQFLMLLASLNSLKLTFHFCPEFTSLASRAMFQTNSQIRHMGLSVWLCTLRFGNLLIIRHKLLCQSHKISISAILWKTHAKPASLFPSASAGCLLGKHTFLFPPRITYRQIWPQYSTTTSHLCNVSK